MDRSIEAGRLRDMPEPHLEEGAVPGRIGREGCIQTLVEHIGVEGDEESGRGCRSRLVVGYIGAGEGPRTVDAGVGESGRRMKVGGSGRRTRVEEDRRSLGSGCSVAVGRIEAAKVLLLMSSSAERRRRG